MAKPASKYPSRAVKTEGDEESAVTGTLSVGEDALQFKGTDLDKTLGLKDLQLDIGGSKNSPVTFMHPDHPEWRFTAYEQRILKESVFRTQGQLRRHIREGRSRQEGIGRVITMMVFVAVFLGAALFLGFGIERSLPQIVAKMSADVDQEIGVKLKEIVEAKHSVTDQHKNVQRQLDNFLYRLLPPAVRTNQHNFRIHIVESPQPNLFGLPSGDIYIFTGVLHRAETSEEVTGMIAHEVAHIMLRNGIIALVTKKGPNMYVQHVLGNDAAIIANVRANAPMLLEKDMPANLLYEADRLALKMLVEANISHIGMGRFMRRIKQLEPKAKYEDLKLPLSLRSPSKARVRGMARLYNEIAVGDPQPLPLLIRPPGGPAAEEEQEGDLDI
ncbi:MAG: M48 family metalloprotease [Limisphaerales bacterium]